MAVNKKKTEESNANEEDKTYKNLTSEEIDELIKNKKEELVRTTQKKFFLEKRLTEKNNELDMFKNEYNDLKSKIEGISQESEKHADKIKEEKTIMNKKSIFYNFQKAEELKKLEKEKIELKSAMKEKHNEAMDNLMSYIDAQRIDLDYVKNKNFEEIEKMNESFHMKIKTIEETFKKYLTEYEIGKKEEIEELIENYTILEKNEIINLKNLYSDHIKEIHEIHKNLLQNLKTYYIDLIKENIQKIKTLKTKIHDLELNDKELKNDLHLFNNQNASMIENIKYLETRREDLKKELKFYSKDFVMYKNLELVYKESSLHIKNMKSFSVTSKEKIGQVEMELQKLSQGVDFSCYFENIKKQNEILRKTLSDLDLNLEELNTELQHYITANGISEEDALKVKKGIEFTLQTYNKEYDNLLYKNKKIKKKIKDNVNIYEKKLKDLNIKK